MQPGRTAVIKRRRARGGTYCANDRLIVTFRTQLAACLDWSGSSHIGGSFVLSSALHCRRLWLSRRKKIFCCLLDHIRPLSIPIIIIRRSRRSVFFIWLLSVWTVGPNVFQQVIQMWFNWWSTHDRLWFRIF